MKKYRLYIYEPYEFDLDNSDNGINGQIIKLLDHKQLLFKSDQNVDFRGLSSCYFLLKSRYEGEDLFVKELIMPNAINILMLDDKGLDISVLPNTTSIDFVGMIGEIKLI